MRRIRVLFVGEHVHGHEVLGPTAFDDAVRVALDGAPDLEARFLPVTPPSAAGRLAARELPGLHGLDVDLQPLRWFLVHGRHTRAAVAAELCRFPADVVHVNTHAITLGTPPVPPHVPLLLSADAAVWDWRAMKTRSAAVRRHSAALFSFCRVLERRALERARAVLTYTRWAEERLAAAAPRATVLHRCPGVDLERFRPGERSPGRRRRAVFVGGRFREKGGDDLLAALEPRLGRDVELDVVTGEPPAPRPGLRVHRLERGDPGLVELLQRADVFCLPSYADTMSFATIEALACGTPAVTSAVGGLPEVVGDAGLTVPRGNRRALREALDSILDDPVRLDGLRVVARERAERLFDARRQSELLFELVREAAGRQRAAEPVPASQRP